MIYLKKFDRYSAPEIIALLLKVFINKECIAKKISRSKHNKKELNGDIIDIKLDSSAFCIVITIREFASSDIITIHSGDGLFLKTEGDYSYLLITNESPIVDKGNFFGEKTVKHQWTITVGKPLY